NWYTTLKPEQLEFTSYPYEWCFDQLKEAALLTLQLAQKGIARNMILKDATPFNIQLHKGRLVFIDSLSFEAYDDQKPWVAYRQFCETFLAPLALMHYHQEPLQPLLYAYPDGIPLNIASSLLPWKSRLNLHVYLHIHLQSKMARSKRAATERPVVFSRQKLLNLLRSLQGLVASFSFKHKGVWSDYYEEAEQRSGYLPHKKEIITQWVDKLTGVSTAVDLGANDGTFSAILSSKGIRTISVDGDHFAISKLYHSVRGSNNNIHPLLIDLANPSPSIGFANEERAAFTERASSDLVVALAFIHHLAIGKNIPLPRIAQWCRKLGRVLIIEFVPLTDEKVQLMLQRKQHTFGWYTKANFEEAFRPYFNILETVKIDSSERILYLMKAI
ncbi:MAG TPA: SAM-dependent methyltransferase, partial [Verrucomicrobiae bacterium]|nr:SAM-dependent methyltransferase [Verrucomicrobiae bacterium]